jgi:hypothetical protein
MMIEKVVCGYDPSCETRKGIKGCLLYTFFKGGVFPINTQAQEPQNSSNGLYQRESEDNFIERIISDAEAGCVCARELIKVIQDFKKQQEQQSELMEMPLAT